MRSRVSSAWSATACCRRCCRKPPRRSQSNRSGALRRMLLEGLRGTDARVANDEPVSPAFLFALLLWPAYCRALMALQAQGVHAAEAQRRAADRVTVHQLNTIALPRRFSLPMQEIWLLQSRFSQRQRKRVFRLLAHPRFRAAFDFLVLRQSASDEHAEDVAFWREAQDAAGRRCSPRSSDAQATDDGRRDGAPRKRRRRRRRGGPRRRRVNTPVHGLRRPGRQPRRRRRPRCARRCRRSTACRDTRLLRASRLYRTPAWGMTEQPDFVNAAALLETRAAARATCSTRCSASSAPSAATARRRQRPLGPAHARPRPAAVRRRRDRRARPARAASAPARARLRAAAAGRDRAGRRHSRHRPGAAMRWRAMAHPATSRR